ncbi:MAG: glutamine--fructose-6-phosphate aminotransferase, partial [Flavobacteriales bacterium]
MCGIVAYMGEEPAYPILINGLHRLEYRGYDSAGIALLEDSLQLYKCRGKVSDLENHINGASIAGTIGMGHTRWATHGEPSDVNAHPHLSMSGNLAIIHNGIIENYIALKKQLEDNGYVFKSETDTEILVNLIEDILKVEKNNLSEAVRLALNQVVGAYAIVVMDINDPNELIAAKKGSPMVVGIGENEFFVASDATPLIEHTKNVVYLEDEEIATLKRGEELKIMNIRKRQKTPYIQELELHLEQLEKGGFEHFMLKEIYEQPRSVRDSMRGRLNAKRGIVQLG